MGALQELLPFSADLSRIPPALRERPRWAPWQAIWNQKRKKYDKVPHRVDSPAENGSTKVPGHWGECERALRCLSLRPGLFAGVGYRLTGPHGVVGIDLDDCVEQGQPASWAQEIIDAADSYTERSPSGNGYRIMGLGCVPADFTNSETGLEVYGGNEPRFLTITGEHLSGTPKDLRPIDPFVLEDLAIQYATRSAQASNVIEIATQPSLLDTSLLPNLESIALPGKVIRFLLKGDHGGQDRSAILHATGVSLYAAGLDDQQVYSILVGNPYALEIALDHRRQDLSRARTYLWREHCQKAKPKGTAAIVSPDEFELVQLTGTQIPKALPPFARDRLGRILATINNATMAIRRPDITGIEVRSDDFRDEIMFSVIGRAQWQPFGDSDYARLRITLETKGFRPISRELIRDVVHLVAGENQFDSAIEWLTPLPWDGTPRVESFLINYLSAQDSPYVRAVGRYLWSALAGRVMEPGVKADMAPILVGAQGLGKSRAVAAIAPGPEFFTEVNLQERDVDLSRLMRGRLVGEIGELRGLNTKDLEAIKAFITRTHENWIPKYKEFATTFPRRLVFIGTTNKDEFLADETGNRRWLPVKVGSVDVAAIVRDRLQLWAEGREHFLARGIDWQDVEALSAPIHEEHTIRDPWEQAISDWLTQAHPLTGVVPASEPFLRISDVLRFALGFENKQVGRRDEMRVGTALRGLGYQREKVWDAVAKRSVWGFIPTKPDIQ